IEGILFFLVVSGSDTYLFFSAECAVATVADIVFLVDGSSSIGIDSFEEVRLFLREVVSGLDIGPDKVRVGLAQYSDEPYQEFLLKDHFDASSLLAAIERLPYRTGQTETGKAISFLLSQYFTEEGGSRARQRVPQIVAVVITDGESQDRVHEAAASLRRSGVIVYSVGVDKANETELIQIASHPPNEHVFIVKSFAELTPLKVKLQKVLCYNIIRQAVTVAGRSSAIKEGSYIHTDGCLQTEEADIFFLIDHSGSIFPSDFKDMINFIIEFIQTFRIGPQYVRMGVVKYADLPELEFGLETYMDAEKTGRALTFMGSLFDKAKDSRGHKVPEYLVVITDGKSSDKVKSPAEKLRSKGVTIYTIGVRGPAEALREKGVKIYAIGVVDANTTQLLEISGSHDRMYSGRDFDALKDLESLLALQLCDPERGEVPKHTCAGSMVSGFT
uniref:VWFA domain-containing protein n=1 Tax=Oryzias sinensis TaxID=183150 RepID=A0A8C7WYE9_9TELE